MNLKEIHLLYMSCHSVLERDELQLFTDMGIDCFSCGAFINPEGHESLNRPGIVGMSRKPELEKFAYENPKTNLPKEFLDNFNVIMVMHTPEWITENWDKMKDKIVIWRSIGQSTTNVENMIRRMKYEGMKVIRYSPMEDNIPTNIGSDGLIRFYKDEEEFKDWNGNTKRVMNITQSLKARWDNCHYNQIMQAMNGFPAIVYGPGNDNLGPLNGGDMPFELLKGALRDNRVFLYGGTWPAPYTLGFIEAMMTGIPIVSIGPQMASDIPAVPPQERFDFFEIPQIIKNGVNGFYSDDMNEIRGYIDKLLNDQDLARKIGEEGRKTAIKLFGKNKIREDWTRFFGSLI